MYACVFSQESVCASLPVKPTELVIARTSCHIALLYVHIRRRQWPPILSAHRLMVQIRFTLVLYYLHTQIPYHHSVFGGFMPFSGCKPYLLRSSMGVDGKRQSKASWRVININKPSPPSITFSLLTRAARQKAWPWVRSAREERRQGAGTSPLTYSQVILDNKH